MRVETLLFRFLTSAAAAVGRMFRKTFLEIAALLVAWGLLPLKAPALDRSISLRCEKAFGAVWDWSASVFGSESWVATVFSLVNNAVKGGLAFKFLFVSFCVGLIYGALMIGVRLVIRGLNGRLR